MRTTTTRSTETRRRLIDAAIEKISAKGVDGTSTREISRRASTTLQAILYHFGSKDGLHLAVADRILIDVEDRCGALPPGDAEKMFLPFTQNSDDKSGLGLGLSIARRSVEANEGMLSVRNVPGIGCIFTIDLPRHLLPADSPVSGNV